MLAGRDLLIGETVAVALGALRANKLRSALTMLGVVIGVAAVVAVVALGRGAQESVNARISALGTTMLTVIPGQVFGRGVASGSDRAKLTLDDANALAEQGRVLTAVEPEMSQNMQVQFGARNANTTVIGTTSNYLDVRKYEMAAGKMFNDAEDRGRERVAVLGAAIPDNLGTTAQALIGQPIRVGGLQ